MGSNLIFIFSNLALGLRNRARAKYHKKKFEFENPKTSGEQNLGSNLITI